MKVELNQKEGEKKKPTESGSILIIENSCSRPITQALGLPL